MGLSVETKEVLGGWDKLCVVVFEKAGREERTWDRPLLRNWKLRNTRSSSTSLGSIVGLSLKPVQDRTGSGGFGGC